MTRMAGYHNDRFGHVLSLGITFMIGYQAAFNMAVALGCVPTKGLALPFISSGGSSILSSLAAIGLLLSVARRYECEADADTSRHTVRPMHNAVSAVGARPFGLSLGRGLFFRKKRKRTVTP